MVREQADFAEVDGIDAEGTRGRILLQSKIALLDVGEERVCVEGVRFHAEGPLSSEVFGRPVRVLRAEVQIVVGVAISQPRLAPLAVASFLNVGRVSGVGRVYYVAPDLGPVDGVHFQ